MTDGPYRTLGEQLSDGERRKRWQAELDYLNLLNAVGRKPDELAKMRKRAEELRRLLLETMPPTGAVAARRRMDEEQQYGFLEAMRRARARGELGPETLRILDIADRLFSIR